MKTIILMVFIVFMTMTSSAVYIKGTGDTTVNTTAPSQDGGCGFNSVGTLLSVQGVVIGKTHFVTARHVTATIGDLFEFRGVSYPLESCVDIGELRVWKISGTFPINSWVDIYTKRNELGKECFVVGRGPIRGEMVTSTFHSGPITITNLVVNECANFSLVGNVGSQVTVQWSTNLSEWIDFTNTYNLTDTITHISVPKIGESCFYRAVGNTTVITNGWKVGGWDGLMRWGKNNVSDTETGRLYTTFDSSGSYDESQTGPNDSGGGMFIKDGTKWKLAGIIDGADDGMWRSQNGDIFYGPMLDKAGLELGWFDGNTFQAWISYSLEYTPAPARAFYTRVSDYATQLAPYTGNN